MNIYSIYIATNKINGKSYIGFDSNWPKRKKAHLYSSNNSKYPDYNYAFHRAIRKHGYESFSWEILYQSLDIEHCLNEMEEYFIHQYDSFINGYNETHGGQAPFLGKKHTKKAKQSISNAHRGNKYNLGKKRSIESIKKQKDNHPNKKDGYVHNMTNFKHSKETIQKMRESKLGPKNSSYGKKHTEETKQKIRQKALERAMQKNCVLSLS
jgi:group I intron endonuclease